MRRALHTPLSASRRPWGQRCAWPAPGQQMHRRGHRGQGGPCPRRGKCDLDLDEGSRGPWGASCWAPPSGQARNRKRGRGWAGTARAFSGRVAAAARRAGCRGAHRGPAGVGVLATAPDRNRVPSSRTQGCRVSRGSVCCDAGGRGGRNGRETVWLAGGGIPRAGRTEGKHSPGPGPLGSGSCPALPWRVTGDKQLGPPKPHCPRPGLVLTLLPAPWAC